MPWRGCGRTSGSGPTWATRRRRWPPPSARWRPSPGCGLRGVSRLYATEPVGVTDQPEFRNAVVALDVPAGPDPATGASALLIALKGLERAFGRQERERWGPREVDLDLLVFGRHRVDVERPPAGRSDDPAKASLPLVVPHVEARRRLFVLAPLSRPRARARAAGLGRDGGHGGCSGSGAWRARTPPARSRPGTARAGRRSPTPTPLGVNPPLGQAELDARTGRRHGPDPRRLSGPAVDHRAAPGRVTTVS